MSCITVFLASFRSCLLADRRGAGAIEFALLAPIFLLILLGMTRVGYAIGVQHALNQLAASAARYALPASTPDRRETLARTYVAENGGVFVLLDASLLDITVEQSPTAFTVQVSMDMSGVPDIPILSAAVRFPDTQFASAVIAVQP